MSEKVRQVNIDYIKSEIQTIAELKSEHEFGSAEHFQKELVHEVKAQKRVNLKKELED